MREQQEAWDKFPNLRPLISTDAEDNELMGDQRKREHQKKEGLGGQVFNVEV